MTRWGRAAVGLVVILVIAASLGRLYTHQAGEWEQRAASAAERARAERVRADSATAAAAFATAQADSLARAADQREVKVRERIVYLRAQPVPDSCQTFTAPRDSVIDSLLVVVDDWKGAYHVQSAASSSLRTANRILSESNDSLLQVIDARPRPRPWYIPEIGVGPFVGACTTGPCAGAGLTLSWRIR